MSTSAPRAADLPTGPRTALPTWLAGLLGTMLIFGVTVAAYAPALRAGFIWDDDFYVTNNRYLEETGGLRRIWLEPGATPQYYPLVFTTFWLEYRLWGLAPAGYHAVNILLHATSAALIWALLRRLALPGAFLAAVLFALHPVHVESVAWITERKNALAGFFFFLALLAWLRFQSLDAPVVAPRRWSWYFAATALFALALLSKTVTCALPAVVLVLAWWKTGRLPWRTVGPTLPLFALGLAGAGVTVWMEQAHVGVEKLDFGLSPIERALLAGRATWFYLGKLIWPAELIFIYPRWEIDARQVWQWAYPLAAILLLALLWLGRQRLGRGPLAAALLFGGLLLPALGFIDVYPMRYSLVADHFQYLASVAPLALLATLWARAETALTGRRGAPAVWLTRGGAAAILALLGLLTWRQTHIYHGFEPLWRNTIARNPGAWMAYNNLGAMLLFQGRTDEARALILRAIEINPDHAQAYNNLAWLALQSGQPAEALTWCEKALATSAPPLAEVHNNLALAQRQLGRIPEAMASFRRSLQISPSFTAARVNLSDLLIQVGDLPAAERELLAARQAEPRSADVHIKLGDLAVARRDIADAERHYAAALRVEPRSLKALYNLANLAGSAGRMREALTLATQVVQLQPAFADGRNLLGALLMQTNQFEQAREHLAEAVRLAPNLLEARYNLAQVLAALGRIDEARAELTLLLQLNPADAEAQTLLQSLTAP